MNLSVEAEDSHNGIRNQQFLQDSQRKTKHSTNQLLMEATAFEKGICWS